MIRLSRRHSYEDTEKYVRDWGRLDLTQIPVVFTMLSMNEELKIKGIPECVAKRNSNPI